MRSFSEVEEETAEKSRPKLVARHEDSALTPIAKGSAHALIIYLCLMFIPPASIGENAPAKSTGVLSSMEWNFWKLFISS